MARYFTNIVKLYADVIFSYAKEHSILENINKDLQAINVHILSDGALFKSISSPIYNDQEQYQFLEKSLEVLNCCQETLNFIFILIKNKRIKIFPSILEKFKLLYQEQINEKNVEIISSYSLSNDEIKALKDKLESLFSAKIKLSLKEDPKILGGLIIKSDNKMFDGSLKTIFDKLTDSVREEVTLL